MQMQGRLANPPPDKARIYAIVDYKYSTTLGMATRTSDLEFFEVPTGSTVIKLQTEAQKKNDSGSSTFGTAVSSIFSVDIVPNGEAVYIFREDSGFVTFAKIISLNFNARGDGWETRIVPRAGQIHCLSLYQRALNRGWTEKRISARIWAEKNDCMILVNRVYSDKVEFETKDKDKKAKLKRQRIERENELRKERGYPLVEEKEQKKEQENEW